jgi:hypothetical protein
MDLEREICRARDLLAEADDSNRVNRLLDLADAYERYADTGCEFAESDRMTGLVVRLIADADLAATGQLSERHVTGTDLEPTLGAILDRIAGEPELICRATLVRDLWERIEDDEAAESIAHLPYGVRQVGGDFEMYLPNSFPKLVRTVFRAWRERRAA